MWRVRALCSSFSIFFLSLPCSWNGCWLMPARYSCNMVAAVAIHATRKTDNFRYSVACRNWQPRRRYIAVAAAAADNSVAIKETARILSSEWWWRRRRRHRCHWYFDAPVLDTLCMHLSLPSDGSSDSCRCTMVLFKALRNVYVNVEMVRAVCHTPSSVECLRGCTNHDQKNMRERTRWNDKCW